MIRVRWLNRKPRPKCVDSVPPMYTLTLQTCYRPKPLNSHQRTPSAPLLASGRISRTVEDASTCPSLREATSDALWRVFPRYRFTTLGYRLLTVTLILILLTCGRSAQPEAAALSRALVKLVHDGDTIVLADGEKLRYVGIDAPEVVHDGEPAEPYGKEARLFNRQLVLGQWVRVELAEERRDKYKRLLAYVFLEDGTFVNGELVRQGYAHLLRRQANLRHWDRLLKLQRQALKAKKGIWSIPVARQETYYLGNRRSWVFHRPHCSFGIQTATRNQVRIKDRYEALYQGFSPGRRCKP